MKWHDVNKFRPRNDCECFIRLEGCDIPLRAKYSASNNIFMMDDVEELPESTDVTEFVQSFCVSSAIKVKRNRT